MPVMSSAAASANSGPSSFLDVRLEPEIEPRLHGIARRAGELLVGDDAHARLEHSSPAMSLPTGSPSQRMTPSEASTNCSSAPATALRRGVDLAGERLLRGGVQRLGLRAGGRGVGGELKPSSRPMAWPSTTTSPVFLISVSSMVFSRSRRISTLVRRSTKRSAAARAARRTACPRRRA
jgi:hypothetical protein